MNTATLALLAVGSLFSPVGDPLLELMRASKGKMALAQWETGKEDYTYRGWPFPEDLKLSASQLAFAEAKVKEFKDYRAYHLLFAIKLNSEKAYESIPSDVKMKVVMSALHDSTILNDWTHLGPTDSTDGEAGRALLALGKDALVHLEPMLKDSTRIRLIGNGEAGIANDLYRYRRKDLAYRYISLLLNKDKEPEFAPNRRERDKAISALMEQLKQNRDIEKPN